LKNGIGIEVDQFDLVVMKKAMENFMGEETKSSLWKGGQHYDLVGVWSVDFFILGWIEPQHGQGEVVFLWALEALPHQQRKVWTVQDERRPWHERRNPMWEIESAKEEDGVCERRKMAMAEGWLGFTLRPLIHILWHN
jgi:hypothetical protein